MSNYIVARFSTTRGEPLYTVAERPVVHFSRLDAEKEAARLARRHQATFVVFAAVTDAWVQDMPVSMYRRDEGRMVNCDSGQG